MRRCACIALVIAGAAMLAAGISTRGARADRNIDADDFDPAALRNSMASQRPQQGPRSALQRPPAQRAADLLDVAAIARYPAGPDNARDVRGDDQLAAEQVASLETVKGRKMRALATEPFEITAEPTESRSDRVARSQMGAAGVAQVAMGEKDGPDAKAVIHATPAIIRFDRVVINISLAGFGS